MHDIYKLKELICDELEEYGKKGEITTGNLDVIQKLSDIAKNLAKVIKMYEEDEEGYSSMMNPYYYDDGMGGRSYARGGRGGSSYARRGRSGGRGRGSNARRDSMGRYSSEGGYSGADEAMEDVLSDMREIMQDMPQEKKMEMQRFIQKMEQM